MNDKLLMSQAIEGINKYFSKVLAIDGSVGTFHYNKRDGKYYLMFWYKNKKIRNKIKSHLSKMFDFECVSEDEELLIYNKITVKDLEAIATLGKLY